MAADSEYTPAAERSFTVADACRLYVENRRRTKGEATAHDAEVRFAATIHGHPLGRVELAQVTQALIEDWRDELLKPDARGRCRSKATANRMLIALRAALNCAFMHRHVGQDRVIEWKLVRPFARAGRRRELFLDLAQRRALLAAASGALRDLIEGVMHTGARAGELRTALVEQFDPRTQCLVLRGKTGERRVILHPAALPLFERLTRGRDRTAYLFTRDDGRHWAHSDWDELVRAAAGRAGLPPGVCLYTLRHSFITEAILGGMTPLEVARIVGTSLAMIDRHYGQFAQTAAREKLARIRFV